MAVWEPWCVLKRYKLFFLALASRAAPIIGKIFELCPRWDVMLRVTLCGIIDISAGPFTGDRRDLETAIINLNNLVSEIRTLITDTSREASSLSSGKASPFVPLEDTKSDITSLNSLIDRMKGSETEAKSLLDKLNSC